MKEFEAHSEQAKVEQAKVEQKRIDYEERRKTAAVSIELMKYNYVRI